MTAHIYYIYSIYKPPDFYNKLVYVRTRTHAEYQTYKEKKAGSFDQLILDGQDLIACRLIRRTYYALYAAI
jgi:hypothetical protein